MKTTRKLFALLMAVIMVFGLASTAFAAGSENNEHTIKINNTASGHEYAAYQVFSGDIANGKLTNIIWGSGVNGNALLAALQADTAFGEGDANLFAKCETAEDVANVLGTNAFTDDGDLTDAFAADVAANLTTTVAGTSTYADGVYTIPVKGDGYYFVKDSKTLTGEDVSYTKYILQVLDDVTVDVKADIPKVDKDIVEDTIEKDANTVDIGDTVNYKFVGTMPSNIADYASYYYVFTDTMSKGLTYNEDLKVVVGGIDVTAFFYVHADVDEDTGVTTIKVGMQDLFDLIAEGGVTAITPTTTVTVTYSATVNEQAKVGVEGETNKVKLEYSNNPNDDAKGEPEEDGEPKPNHPVGTTPEDVVVSYLTEIVLTKVDAADGKTLEGAKFSISGISSKVVVINKEMFVELAEGETADPVYYRLKDGTYTTTAPVAEDDPSTTDVDEKNIDDYDGTARYKKITVIDKENRESNFTAEGWVDADGKLTFTGLGEGTYTITELIAPNGYNLLKAPITVVVTSDVASLTIVDGTEQITWSAANGTDEDAEEYSVENGIIYITVENTSGTVLPSTGGIGTTIFYVVGSILVAAAMILLITKKRMAA